MKSKAAKAKPEIKHSKIMLWSYYFGVFGLFPVFGLPLALTAIVLGIYGLILIKSNPTLRGKGYAIAGILLGLVQIIFFSSQVIPVILNR